MRLFKKKFDIWLSLGYNCHVSYAYRALFGKDPTPYLFNWVFIETLNDLNAFLNNPSILGSGNLEYKYGLYRDSVTHFYYHTKADKNSLMDQTGKLNVENIAHDSKNVISRMLHLKDKFFNIISSDKKCVFMCTVKRYEDPKQVNSMIKNISKNIFAISGNKHNKIIFIFEKEYLSKLKLDKIKNVVFASIPLFPPDGESDQIDFNAWYKIYKKVDIQNAAYQKKNIEEFIRIHPQKYYCNSKH